MPSSMLENGKVELTKKKEKYEGKLYFTVTDFARFRGISGL